MPKKDRQSDRLTPGFTGPYKGEPQQGTLFDARAVRNLPGNQPAEQKRIGPRGYSRERSQQFQEVVPRVFNENSLPMSGRIGVGSKETAQEEYYGTQGASYSKEEGGTVRHPHVTPDTHVFGPADVIHANAYTGRRGRLGDVDTEWRAGEINEKSMRRPQSKMIDALARSTIKPEHLDNLEGIRLADQDEIDASGIYYKHSTRIALGADRRPKGVENQQTGVVDADHEQTLFHEIGHHVSYQERTEHSAYREPWQQGAEEAYADRFALTHWRLDPRQKKSWEGPIDPREHTYYGRNNRGYGNPNPASSSTAARHYQANFPQDLRVSRQLSPFSREDLYTESQERPFLDAGQPEHVFDEQKMGVKPLDLMSRMNNEPPTRLDAHGRALLQRQREEKDAAPVVAKRWQVR